MNTIFSVIQMILAVFLVIAILLQQKGAGLGGAFGGSSNIYSTKRGVDKVLFQATIAITVLFFGIAIVSLIVS